MPVAGASRSPASNHHSRTTSGNRLPCDGPRHAHSGTTSRCCRSLLQASTSVGPQLWSHIYKREIRWEVELQGHAPELPIVQQVRIGPVAAACFGPRQAIQFAAEDAQLLSHIPWATLQSLFEDSHERVEVGRVDRPLELDATTLQ